MSTERRRYFRIEDRALIKYRVIGLDAVERERQFIRLNEIRAANLHAALLGLDMRLQELIDDIHDDDRPLAQALELLNRKLNLIERVVALEATPRGAPEEREHASSDISMSGGGLALRADSPLELHAYLAVDLVLLPSHHPMRALGRVVDCRRFTAGDYSIAIEFDEIREEDRDLLIQHIVRRQSALLRLERQGDAV